jgi:hypothetical protein
MKKIIVEGTEIRVVGEKEDSQFFSLTDIAKRSSDRPDQVIGNWIRTRNTIEFLAVWEELYNPNFNPINYEGIKNQAGAPTFTLSISDWVINTNAIGIYAKAGRYGGSFAHRDIALEFCSWLQPAFRLYIIKEFQRLKKEEGSLLAQEWDVRRLIAKTNYKIHTESVKHYLIPQRLQRDKAAGLYYASEADMLNIALFGITAKQWKDQNPNAKGNLRDAASIEQLLVLSNLESLNSELIKMGLAHDERLDQLNNAAISQMHIIMQNNNFQSLESGNTNETKLLE